MENNWRHYTQFASEAELRIIAAKISMALSAGTTLKIFLTALLLLPAPLAAQERPALAENPLAQLKDEIQRVLADAGLPFNVEQEKAIILMMEDRRKASEDLFGDLMDFRAGPTRGDESDRLRSAIEWMRS